MEGGSSLQTKHHFLIRYELTNLEGKCYMGIKGVTWKAGGKGMVNFGVWDLLEIIQLSFKFKCSFISFGHYICENFINLS